MDMKLENASENTSNEYIYQADSLSTDIELEAEGSIDLREITQGILDMEESGNDFSASCSIPSSPPPSYEHVLAETKIAEEAAAAELHYKPEPISESCKGIEEFTSTEELSDRIAEPRKGIEIIHKSHKEFYRAVAKQWGITCKMSDHCRCINCQSMYFECEYDQNEQEKTDGGLGAGTPMFISEVMHGTACTLL